MHLHLHLQSGKDPNFIWDGSNCQEKGYKEEDKEEPGVQGRRWLWSTFSGCQASHTAASQPQGKVTVSTPALHDHVDFQPWVNAMKMFSNQMI